MRPGTAMVCLELSGDGVLDVPASERRIGPASVADQPLPFGGQNVTPNTFLFISSLHA